MPRLSIDGHEVSCPEHSTILAAAAEAGVEIPTLCADPRLAPSGACRLCIVAVDGAARPQAACTTPVADGMVVHTHTPEVDGLRHTLLGIDLSAGGIRVEPHPDLAIGDRVCIAIYDAAGGATLVLEAEAVRDEGARGVVLHFRNVSPDAHERIGRIVGATPQIESAGAAGSGVVVAEMLAQQPA